MTALAEARLFLSSIHGALFSSSVIYDTAGLIMSMASKTPFNGVPFGSTSEFIVVRALDEGGMSVKKRLHINKPAVSFITEWARLNLDVSMV